MLETVPVGHELSGARARSALEPREGTRGTNGWDKLRNLNPSSRSGTGHGGWRSVGIGWVGRCYVVIASVVTPDTIMRWHRQFIVWKWTYTHKATKTGLLLRSRRARRAARTF